MKKALKSIASLILCALLLASCSSSKENVPEVDSGTQETAETESIADMESKVNIDKELLAANKSKPDDTEVSAGQSERPTITVSKMIDDNLVFFAGKVSPDAVVKITGGVEDMTFTPDDDNYWAAVYIPDETTVLTVTAVEAGKEPSEPITITAKPEPGLTLFEDHGVCGVVVGDKFQGHFQGAIDDYIGANLLTDKQKSGVTSAMEKRVAQCEAKGAKLVYLLIPNPMNIYPETVPSEYERYTDDSLTKQFSEIAISCGADVVDLTDVFLEHRDDEFKLFNKMDSHWTEYGAYYAYLSMCDYFSGDFPDTVPRDESLFNFYEEDLYAGDMATHLEIDNKTMHEMTTVCDLLFDAPYDPDFFMPGKMEVEHSVTSGGHKVDNTDETRDLPNVVIYRDSFSSAIEAMMTDTTDVSYWNDMWNYNFDASLIDRYDADYVIYLIAERNIKNVMY